MSSVSRRSLGRASALMFSLSRSDVLYTQRTSVIAPPLTTMVICNVPYLWVTAGPVNVPLRSAVFGGAAAVVVGALWGCVAEVVARFGGGGGAPVGVASAAPAVGVADRAGSADPPSNGASANVSALSDGGVP